MKESGASLFPALRHVKQTDCHSRHEPSSRFGRMPEACRFPVLSGAAQQIIETGFVPQRIELRFDVELHDPVRAIRIRFLKIGERLRIVF